MKLKNVSEIFVRWHFVAQQALWVFLTAAFFHTLGPFWEPSKSLAVAVFHWRIGIITTLSSPSACPRTESNVGTLSHRHPIDLEHSGARMHPANDTIYTLFMTFTLMVGLLSAFTALGGERFATTLTETTDTSGTWCQAGTNVEGRVPKICPRYRYLPAHRRMIDDAVVVWMLDEQSYVSPIRHSHPRRMHPLGLGCCFAA